MKDIKDILSELGSSFFQAGQIAAKTCRFASMVKGTLFLILPASSCGNMVKIFGQIGVRIKEKLEGELRISMAPIRVLGLKIYQDLTLNYSFLQNHSDLIGELEQIIPINPVGISTYQILVDRLQLKQDPYFFILKSYPSQH